MAITKALMYARLSSTASTGTLLYKKARLGATRLNFYGPKHLLKVNGTIRTGNFDATNWEVTERAKGQGATLRIELFGFTPGVGEEIILGAGAFTNRLFRGTIVRRRQVRHRLNDGRVIWACQCVDWTYQLGNLKVTKKYASQSGTEIARDLIATFAPAGFTTSHVQSGLATVDEIQFTMQTLPSAFQQLCDRLGATFYVDAEKDLHLGTTDPTATAPEAITDSNKHTRDFGYDEDIENLRNRVLCEGKGSAVSTSVAAATTTLPVQDTSMFATSGTNYAKLEAQLLTYTGVSALAGQGSLTAGVPGSAPTPPSPVQATPYVTGSLTNGTYSYKVTFVSALGESDASSAASAAVAAVPFSASDAPTGVTGATGGSLVAGGTYIYAVTFVTASGEVGHAFSGLSTWALGGANTKANLTGIPTSSDPRVTSRKVYRTTNGGASLLLVTTIADNTTTTLADTTADASLGAAAPTTDTGSTGKLTVGIPLGPTGTTSRKLYRTAVGGATYKLQSTTADNTTTSVLDNTADASLGAAFAGTTLGASPGDTTIRVSDLSKFPDGGWVRVGSQVIFFTGRSAVSGEGTLTGIPASGAGAILSSIPAGSTIVVEPHLTGIPASGTYAIANALADGESVNLLVTADDATSQATYGVREQFEQDRRLSIAGAQDRADAVLALLKDVRVGGSFPTSDPKVRGGRKLSINSATWGLTATVTLQSVTIKPDSKRPQPMAQATFASRTLDDLFTQLREIRERLAQ